LVKNSIPSSPPRWPDSTSGQTRRAGAGGGRGVERLAGVPSRSCPRGVLRRRPWAQRPAPHRQIAKRLQDTGASGGDGGALDLWPEGAEEPGRLDALRQLGEAAQRAGDLTGSIRAWREAATGYRDRREPGRLGDALRSVGGVLELQGRWEDAIETRQQASAAFAEAALADSYEHAGEHEAAQATYKAAFGYCSANALEPMSQLCLGCLSVALRQAGDWAQADGVCRQVLSSPATTTLAGHRGAPLRHLALALGRDGVR